MTDTTYTVSIVTRDDNDLITTAVVGRFANKIKAMTAAKRAAHATARDCTGYGPTSFAYVGDKVTAVVSWS